MLAVLAPSTIGPEIYAFGAAGLVVAVGGLVIVTLVLRQRRWLPSTPVEFTTWTSMVVAALSLGAAAIHFAVIGEHFAEYPPYGVAFTAFAWFQTGWAIVYLRRGGQGLAMLAIAVNVGALAVWAYSRVRGLPIGPEAGRIEPIGPLDVAAGGLEALLIAFLVWTRLATTVRTRPTLSPASTIVYVGFVLLAVVVLTSSALALGGGSDQALAGHAHAEPSPIGSLAPGASDLPALAETTPAAGATRPASLPPEANGGPPGVVAFGTGMDLSGQLQGLTVGFRPGQTAIWLADLREPVGQPTVRFIIVQILPDGREFEHWRQDMPVADQRGRQLVGMADLSIYVHGGAGNYRMRYFRGDELLAEGAFELLP